MPPQSLPLASESWEGARLALQNAEAHLTSAELLAGDGLYGFALSHLVLATEEAVKSFSFVVSAIGLHFPEADARRLMTNHKARHAVALLGQVVTDFISRSSEAEALVSHGEIPVPEALLDQIPVMFSGWGSYLSGDHTPEFTFDLEWWGRANTLKQSGMYVDYDSQTGWKSPSGVAEIEYRESAASVERFFSTVVKSIKPLLNTDTETQALVSTWLIPLVQQLNSGRAEEISETIFGSSGKT
jgi:AbiV family abortive infection protein